MNYSFEPSNILLNSEKIRVVNWFKILLYSYNFIIESCKFTIVYYEFNIFIYIFVLD